MTEERSHQFIHEAELAERYVTGRMPGPERMAFEDHFVTCAECQRDVRFARAVRAALEATGARTPSRTPATPAAASARAPRRRQRGLWVGAAMAAGIAGIAVLYALPSRAVTALGGVEQPPAYVGVAVRSTAGRGAAMFDDAMKDYSTGRYAVATRGLQAALAAGQDSIPTDFFIGASELFGGDARNAAAAFARVVSLGESPYRDEAQWYEAKALLRLGRSAEAIAALAAYAPADPEMGARFAALTDSVKQAVAR